MSSSLLVTRRAATINQVTLPHASRRGDFPDTLALHEARWDAWVEKGVVADAAFAEKIRALGVLGFAVLGVGAVWVMFR